MSAEDIKRVLDKIAKCMRLSASSEPNEAAAALRQAQKLMSMHGLSEEDVNASRYTNEVYNTAVQCSKNDVPVQLVALCKLIRRAFGVHVVIERSISVTDMNYSFRIFGLEHRTPMALHCFGVIFKGMEDAWKDFLVKNPGIKKVRNARASFQFGWLNGIGERVDAIGFKDNEIATLDLVKSSHYQREMEAYKPKAGQTLYCGLESRGRASSKDFAIHRPMNGGEKLKELK